MSNILNTELSKAAKGVGTLKLLALIIGSLIAGSLIVIWGEQLFSRTFPHPHFFIRFLCILGISGIAWIILKPKFDRQFHHDAELTTKLRRYPRLLFMALSWGIFIFLVGQTAVYALNYIIPVGEPVYRKAQVIDKYKTHHRKSLIDSRTLEFSFTDYSKLKIAAGSELYNSMDIADSCSVKIQKGIFGLNAVKDIEVFYRYEVPQSSWPD